MRDAQTYTDWIAIDWGTSKLRAWYMAADGSLCAYATSEDGAGRLERNRFESALISLVGPWLAQGQTQVIACGMVGSRQGWVEAPYLSAPCLPLASTLVRAPARDPRLGVHVIPGIRQDRPADVMRGEETQIAGFISANPDFNGILCLPGTHTKWVELSAGEVVRFQTFMTGELFACIGEMTMLRHTLAGKGWDADGFSQAVSDSFSRPEQCAARLFSLRAEGLLHDLAPATARARLSGTLIGVELAAARSYWLGRQVAIVGTAQLAQLYDVALRGQGLAATRADSSEMTLRGLTAAYRLLKAT